MNNPNNLSAMLVLAITLSLAQTPTVMAESDSVREIAQIVIQLNHRPSAADKARLNDIAQHGSAAEITIAKALLQMDHKVSSADKAKLSDIAKDDSLPSNTRDLAMIIQNLNHKASAADIGKLRGM